MKIKIKKLHPDAIIPEYKTDGAAGFVQVEELTETARGSGGFGSTGV